ncbi:NAD(P)-binding protein [Eremomyces bilateralis CBS 781.70]|uniref:NAD(P)-binding protein n=1 Tax=Eremomyces bilateralis CBS 781.70 TaxID=1392243 RepID=A0A6G1G8Y4_9PEZI|nr:NAD(P)-binding protein [Eremomyces bilateralis CBS 781.70]KAF1814371.1 NAD(P)-binding protein [Eremomyces bilateralis CBS 781.70]
MSQSVIRIDGERKSVRSLKAFQESISEPAKHEVLIKVHSVSLNYRDIVIATSKYPYPVKDRVIPCSDAAGIVVRFHGQGGPIDGVLREYVNIPATSAVKIRKDSPQNFSEWSTVVCTGVTAWNALYGQPASETGSDCLIPRFGADHGVNYKTHPEWSKEVLRLTNGEGVDYVLENDGSGTIAESLNCVKMGGNVSVIGFLSQAKQSEMPDVAGLALSKGAVVRGVIVGSTQLLEEVVQFVARKELRLPVEREFKFTQEDVVNAYEYASSGTHIGKVCIKLVE